MFVYSLAVTTVTAAGLFVIGVLQLPLLNPGSSYSDAIRSTVSVLAFAAFLVLPMLLFYMLAVAGVVGVIRRRSWWAGALAGLIPALLFYGLFTLLNGNGITYIGTPEELQTADTVNRVSAILSILWCGIAGTALIKLARTSNSSKTVPMDAP